MNRPRPTGTALAAATALVALAVPAGPSAAAPAAPEPAGPVFVQTDDPAANAVVAYHRAPDGSLRRAGVHPTGGKGGVLTGSVVDHLASQGSLTYDRAHRLLLAVNAGSDTLTVFSVDGDRLHRRQVVASGGDFPVSATVHGGLAYVLNARRGGSVQGFRLVADGLRPVAAWHRELGLATATAPEFTHTPAQVSFTPDGSRLVVTTKAGGAAVEVFGLDPSGAPSPRPAVNTAAGSVPSGFTFDAHGRLVVTDAATNAVVTYRLDPDGRTHRIDDAPTGQEATCRIVRAGDHYYASDAGSDTLSGFRQTGHVLHPLDLTATGAAPVDSAVTPDGRHLYVRTGGKGAVDAFLIAADGSLTPAGTVAVPGAAGGEGIVAL